MITKEEKLKKRKEWWNENKERLNRERRECPKEKKEHSNKLLKEWREKNKEHFNEWQRKDFEKNKDKRHKQNLDTYYKHHEKYLLSRRIAIKKKRDEQKLIVLNHYSNGKNRCKLCGFTDKEALTVDHINGGGTKHRKELKGRHIEYWLIKNNFPEGFRILCWNCQAKERIKKNQFNPSNKINFDNIQEVKND